MGCGATTAMLVRGAFDPVFSLQIRDRNDQLSEEGSQELAGRERALMEADGGAAERGGGKGIRVDDALNNQSSATGLEYDTTRDPSPREALDLIVDKVRDGMPVVVTIGSEPGKYAHYVTCLQIRTVEAGTELQFHNTAGGGETTWVPDSAVLNGALEFSQGSQVTAVDVPSAM